MTTTALHEVIHILGFDATLYDTYIDSTTTGNIGHLYSPPIYQSVNLNVARTGGNNYILKTPRVTAFAKAFFNCPSLQGMAL